MALSFGQLPFEVRDLIVKASVLGVKIVCALPKRLARSRPQFQIAIGVIRANAVLVMDVLVRFQVAAESLLHHEVVLKNVARNGSVRVIRGLEVDVPGRVYGAAALPVVMRFTSPCWRTMMRQIDQSTLALDVPPSSAGQASGYHRSAAASTQSSFLNPSRGQYFPNGVDALTVAAKIRLAIRRGQILWDSILQACRDRLSATASAKGSLCNAVRRPYMTTLKSEVEVMVELVARLLFSLRAVRQEDDFFAAAAST